LIISKVREELVEEMVIPYQNILIKHINKISVDQFLCHSLHHDIVVDDNHKQHEVIEFVHFSNREKTSIE
jgi:hypothetical protein